MPLQIRGLARITLAPLTDTLPCLGAVQISLLEEPYIDFSISLFGSLDLMLLPILKDAVNIAANKVRNMSHASATLDRQVRSKVKWVCYSRHTPLHAPQPLNCCLTTCLLGVARTSINTFVTRLSRLSPFDESGSE